MKKVLLLGLGLFIVGMMSGMAQSEEPFSVGEKWTYKHEGMVPMRPPDYDMAGDRTIEVVGKKGEGDDQRWLIQEKWGDYDDFAGTRLVDAKHMYSRMESGGDRVTTIEPAYAYDYFSLKPGEEKSLESTFSFGENWTIPIKATAKRVADETIEVPAGKFENCIQIEIKESVTFSPPNGGDEMTITTTRKQWYHPKVNGLVKETMERQSFDGGTDKGVSELKSYQKEKKES